MKKAIVSFVASIVVFSVYLYLFENNQLLSSTYGRDTEQVVQILDMGMSNFFKYLEIIISSILMGISGLSFGRLACKKFGC